MARRCCSNALTVQLGPYFPSYVVQVEVARALGLSKDTMARQQLPKPKGAEISCPAP